jgi:hypothetical protein
MRASRHRAALIGAVVVVAGLAAAVVGALVLSSSADSEAEPTRAQYFDRVAAICRVYGPKLDRIPPPDASGTGDVVAAIRAALPLVKGQEREVRALDAPAELRGPLARWFDLQDLRIGMLEKALRAAGRQDYLAVGVAYIDFTLSGSKIARLGKTLGIPHPPC